MVGDKPLIRFLPESVFFFAFYQFYHPKNMKTWWTISDFMWFSGKFQVPKPHFPIKCAMDAAPGSHIRCALQSTLTHCWCPCDRVVWVIPPTDFVVGLHDRKCLGKAFQPRVAMRAHGTWSLVNGSMMVNASSCWPCWLVFGTVTSQGRVGAEPNSHRLPICLGLEDYFPRKIVQLSGVHL